MKAQRIIAFLFGLTAISSGFSQSPTVAVSTTIKVTLVGSCDIMANCDTTENSSLTGNHSFEISPTQVDQLGPGTSVTVFMTGGVEKSFLLGDDPNYQAGDDSAVIDTIVSVVNNPIPATIKLSWKKGIFNLSLKAKGTRRTSVITVGTVAAASLAEKIQRDGALPPGNPLLRYYTETRLEDSSGVFATSSGYFTGQLIQNIKADPLPNGGIKQSVLVSLKPKYQIAE